MPNYDNIDEEYDIVLTKQKSNLNQMVNQMEKE